MRALILGGIAWNTMVYLDRFPPAEPHTVFSSGYHETVGSSGAGKALNLAHLGWDVTLWGALGDDQAASHIRSYFTETAVDLISVLDPRGTVWHVNLMDNAGDRISIFANAGSQDLEFDPGFIEPLLDQVDLVSVTTYNYCRRFLPVLRNADIPVWIDIHDYDGVNPYHSEFIEYADHLFLSSLHLVNYRRFMEERFQSGATTVVCTHGAQGATGLDRNGWKDVPAQVVPQIVDSNGAGDAFFSGFATNWLQTKDLDSAMKAGTRLGALAVQCSELAPSRLNVPDS